MMFVMLANEGMEGRGGGEQGETAPSTPRPFPFLLSFFLGKDFIYGGLSF